MCRYDINIWYICQRFFCFGQSAIIKAMKVLVFTSEDSQETRDAKELGQNLADDGVEVEYFDPEMPETSGKQELYNIYSYPSFVVVSDDGQVVESWRGRIPLTGDIKIFLA